MTASMVGGKSEQLVVNFTADTLTAQVNLNVTEDNFIANNIGMTRLQATVTDGNGNPVEGIKVNFRGTSVTLSSTSVETDDQVFAEILVTSTEVGLKTVSASLADKPTEVISRLLNAKVDVNSATITSQEIPEGQVMVAQDIAVKAHVNDQFGNPVTHQPATFSAAPSSQMIISQNTVSTNTQGVAEVTMTPERNGSYTVKASLANGASLEKQLEAIDEKLTLTSSPLIGVNAPKGVTSAGGMQTVDISLVAGPADASQSILKNNQSSLKGDFTDSAELHLVLHDISGNPIKVSEGMEFVQSGTNVPYMKISAIDYTQNINGDYKATVTGGGEGIATLIPVLNGVHQAGLSTTIEFISAETRPMTGTVSVNGANLPTASFPSQGFTGAYYQLNNDNFAPGKTAADYSFQTRPLG